MTLIDSDRLWPHPFTHVVNGAVQTAQPIRSQSALTFGRGNRLFTIRFTARRQFTTLALCYEHILVKVPAMVGARGTLTVEPPGGGRFRAVNCVCSSALGDHDGVMAIVEAEFVGPPFIP